MNDPREELPEEDQQQWQQQWQQEYEAWLDEVELNLNSELGEKYAQYHSNDRQR